MRDAIDDTFYSNNDPSVTQITETQEAAHIPWGTVLTNRLNHLALLESGRERTSGLASDEGKQEDNKRYFSCSYPGDI